MSQSSVWERVKTSSKSGFDKVYKVVDKAGAPINRLSNRLGSEAFWPTTLDKECDKAARILKTFCKDGFYTEEEYQSPDGPQKKQKVLKKIPTSVIQNAKGLAIFTTMRTGLWVSGAGGSGILIARQEDGAWSPPSGILLHTAGLGFLVGVDIYDCVVVINSDEALEAFTKIRCTLGSEISVTAGPVGAGGVLESEVHKRQAPVFTYMKSRGFYAGVQIDGTVIIERTDENERFYGQRIAVKDILLGNIRHPPYEIQRLLETLKAAQGDTNLDESLIPTEAPPGDYEIEDGHVFGVPDIEDPDPYGVLALEKEGMSIKEAGTQKRASWEAFSFHPSPTSPIHDLYDRGSMERRRSGSARKSWRMSSTSAHLNSARSVRNSIDQTPRTPARMSDMSTQTDEDPPTISRHHSRTSSTLAGDRGYMRDVPENDILETSMEKAESESVREVNGYTTPPQTPPMMAKVHEMVDEHDDDDDVQIEEPVVQSVKVFQPAPAQIITKARLVNVPKREPPKLPPRNPQRSEPVVVDASPRAASTDDVSVDSTSTESKHDSAHEPPSEKEVDVDHVTARLENATVDDSSDKEDLRPDPWAKVEEAKVSSAEAPITLTRPDLYEGV